MAPFNSTNTSASDSNKPTTIDSSSSSSSSSLSSASKLSLNQNRVLIGDRIYDVDLLASIHPGGELFVKAFGGRDATEAFYSYHRRSFPHEKAEVMDCCLGPASTPSKPDLSVDSDYLELCDRVAKVLPMHKSFAPFSYYLKMIVMLGSCIGLELYLHHSKRYIWYLCAVQGWLMALVGLNIQHDANHGAISRNPYINRVLGMTQNWIGGSAVDWIHQHVVQHHVNCNDIHNDPDLAGNIALRINPIKPLLPQHLFQHLYIFILIGFFGFNVVWESFMHVFKGKMFTNYAEKLRSYTGFETLCSIGYFVRWILVPYLQTGTLTTLIHVIPMFVVGGYYLALFFLISHNFKDVHILDKSLPSSNQSFLYKQVVSSSNVGGRLLCFMNGGLNYQIEHHLFPRIQHSHYPTIAPIVREFCEEKGIPYIHFEHLSDNIKSCSQHLHEMGSLQEHKVE